MKKLIGAITGCIAAYYVIDALAVYLWRVYGPIWYKWGIRRLQTN